MSSRPDPLDLRELGLLLDEDADFDLLSARPSSSRPSSSRLSSSRPSSSRSASGAPRPGDSRLSVGSRLPRGGGESFAADASRSVPRSVGGGSGVFSEPPMESPRGSDTPMPVVFISEQTVASTCRGTYPATSRFCIKRILPGQHHCGISSHRNKKYSVKGDTYWAPGGYVRGELVALCGECVAKDKIPEDMRQLFGANERRSSVEWRNLIIDAAIPIPTLNSVRSEHLSVGGGREGENFDEEREDEDADDALYDEHKVISLLGENGVIEEDFGFEEWDDVRDEEVGQGWVKHIEQHQRAMDGCMAKMSGHRAKLIAVVKKLDGEVVPIVNSVVRKLSVLATRQTTMQEAMDHMSTMLGVLEDRVKAREEEDDGGLAFCVDEMTSLKEDLTSLQKDVLTNASSSKEVEGVVAGLIQKVNAVSAARTAAVAKRVSVLEAKSGWVHVGEGDEDDLRSAVSVGSRSREGVLAASGASDVITRLKTLEAKVEIQLERAKSQGVIFHNKVAFSSEMEFMQWYMKENTSGKGLAAFVDLVSIWAFASLATETASEWLQSLSRQRTVGLDNKVEVEYSHSMSTRYPVAFVGKAELITSTQTFKIFEKLVLWRGGGVGDGVKERLLDSLRMAVECQRVYCEDLIPAGVVRDHAIRSAEFTRDFFQAFVVHIEDEITMLTSFGLGEAQVMLLMSNQLMQICDDLFEFRHAAINVANSNRTETGARYAWVSLQALGKMSEYLKSKFKHHPSITGTFVRFLTRQTADTSASGLKAKVDALEATVKALKTSAVSKTELANLHNKLDIIVAANDLKKK